MMNIKSTHTKSLVTLALTAIFTLQLLWLNNVYSERKESIYYRITDLIKLSINEELINREKQLGGTVLRTFSSLEKDTSTVRNLTIITADNTLKIPYNCINRFNEYKIKQTALKNTIPININDLDSIFNNLLLEASIFAKFVAIEIHDTEKGEISQTRKLVSYPWVQSFETETFWVDLADSLGIKAYLKIPVETIFRQLLLQLILSVVLIAGVTVCIFRLSKTIFRQYKEERIKKDFINVMTHEFKRPIISSLYAMEILYDNAVAQDKELINDSILELKKLNFYVEKIQEISRGEERKIDIEKENIQLLPFFIKLKEKYESTKEKIVSIQLNIDNDIIIRSNKVHFSNIMDNLTENSINYSNENVNIKILVFIENGYIHIHHRDDGWGIASSEIPFVFENFFRGISTEKRKKRGFGLGLSYVKTMIEQLGGSISVESKEGIYTEFILKHPL